MVTIALNIENVKWEERILAEQEVSQRRQGNATVRDVRLVEVNRFNMPCGSYWEHMQQYAYDQGAYTFLWQVK